MTEPTDTELDAVVCKHWPAFSMQATLVRMWVRAAMRDAIAKWDTPPAEQQAASSAVLKAIREANMQLVRTGDDAFMLVPYKRATAEQQAAPKAAPVVWLSSKQLRGVTTLHGQYLPFRCQPEGRFDTPVYLVEAAPKTAPQQEAQEPGEINKLRAEALRLSEILLAISSEGSSPEPEDLWADDYEPSDGDVYVHRAGLVLAMLATAPQPAPAPLSEKDLRTRFEALARDSYNFKRSRSDCYVNPATARDWKWFRLGATVATQGDKP